MSKLRRKPQNWRQNVSVPWARMCCIKGSNNRQKLMIPVIKSGIHYRKWWLTTQFSKEMIDFCFVLCSCGSLLNCGRNGRPMDRQRKNTKSWKKRKKVSKEENSRYIRRMGGSCRKGNKPLLATKISLIFCAHTLRVQLFVKVVGATELGLYHY